LGRDADARIGHSNRERSVVVPGGDGNGTFRGELYRVAQQVHEDLPHFVLICGQQWEASVDLLHETDALALYRRLKRVETHIDQRRELKTDRMDLHPSSLDLGEVEDIVDEC